MKSAYECDSGAIFQPIRDLLIWELTIHRDCGVKIGAPYQDCLECDLEHRTNINDKVFTVLFPIFNLNLLHSRIASHSQTSNSSLFTT